MTQPAASAPSKKVVVIEADDDFLHLIRVILADGRMELFLATTGGDGLALISQHRPDLVILDLTLPDMKGWEVFIQMRRAMAHSWPIPVIILADEGTRLDRTFSLRVAQVDDYLMKPFLPSQLRRSVCGALHLYDLPLGPRAAS